MGFHQRTARCFQQGTGFFQGRHYCISSSWWETGFCKNVGHPTLDFRGGIPSFQSSLWVHLTRTLLSDSHQVIFAKANDPDLHQVVGLSGQKSIGLLRVTMHLRTWHLEASMCFENLPVRIDTQRHSLSHAANTY